MHQLIEDQARRRPDATAISFEGQSLTYREFNRRADLLASYLIDLGVGPEVLVGLFVERSLEMMIGLLGILKAGGAYLPMDTTFPQDRIAFMLGDASGRVVLTQTSLLNHLPHTSADTICLDTIDWCNSVSCLKSVLSVTPKNLAYVIYTSGSTGRPKGVCIEHRNIVNYVMGISNRLRLEPGWNYALVSTIAADLGNTVIFPALATGGCVHIISQERLQNQAMLAEYFEEAKIDVLKIVPSHLSALQAGRNPEKIMPRRRLILGGESSRLPWIEQLHDLAPHCEIYNHYGPTETTVGVLTYRVGSNLPSTQSGTLPLGKPLPNCRAEILDEQGQKVPIGATGELYIGGEGVGRGYLNRNDLTAEKFITDPFPGLGQRLYRTGDLARYLPDGNIEFLGRIDHQVKINGYRIELGEVEQVLRSHAGVSDALVMANDDARGNKQLVACVIPKRANQPLWNQKNIYILPDGSPVAHLNRNETDYIYNEIFVRQAYLRHGVSLKDGDCILDVGSNIGLFTVFASRIAKNLKIIAFEPNPSAFACLEANAQAWGDGVKCIPVGLSSEKKSGDLTFFEGLSLLSGFYADASVEREVVRRYVLNQDSSVGENGHLSSEVERLIEDRLQAKVVRAQLETLSSIIAEERIQSIDLLKINVEKSELDVLLGLTAADWPKIRQLVIEVDLQENLDPIVRLLEGNGYEVAVEQDPLLKTTALHYVYAIRMTKAGTAARAQTPVEVPVAIPPADNTILSPPSLRKYLSERLPGYMIPATFVLMQEFPLTPNGKIDRAKLATLSPENGHVSREPVKLKTETEKTLAKIWTELLQMENIAADDDFFEIGGNSLQAIRIISRIRDTFEVDLPLRVLFERPTIPGLAEAIDALTWIANSPTHNEAAQEREEIEL